MANSQNSRCRARTLVHRQFQRAEVSKVGDMSTNPVQGIELRQISKGVWQLSRPQAWRGLFLSRHHSTTLPFLSAFLNTGVTQWCRGAAAGIWSCMSFCTASRSSSLFPRGRYRGVLLHSKLALMFRQNGTQSGLNNTSERVAFLSTTHKLLHLSSPLSGSISLILASFPLIFQWNLSLHCFREVSRSRRGAMRSY